MYEIFISYRRSDGTELARSLKNELSGVYDVFFDHSSLFDGNFRTKLHLALEEAPVFLCLMTRNFFGEWGKTDDCIQDELSTAIELNKVIIPIEVVGSFQGIPSDIPAVLKAPFSNIHFSLLHNDQTFERDIQDIINNRIKKVVERCRDERKRAKNEIEKAFCYLWGSNGKQRDLSKAFLIFSDIYKAFPYMTVAMVGKGLCFRENQQFNEAIDCFKQAGEKGDGWGYYLIAQFYEETGKSPIHYGKYYDLSAELDYAPAWIKKGNEAIGFNDSKKALSCFTQAAKLGDTDGLYQSALIYEEEGNNQKAIDLILEAVNKNNLAAINHLGVLYSRGTIVKKDKIKAYSLVSKAAEAGFVLAQYNKGCMLCDGFGVEKDKRLGKKWLEIAAQNGSKNASIKLQEINKGLFHTISDFLFK